MIPCGSPPAAQIDFQVANLRKENYKSVAKEPYENAEALFARADSFGLALADAEDISQRQQVDSLIVTPFLKDVNKEMRNLILSAFSRNMRLPDPFTPNLKVDLLPEISQSPRILSDVEAALKLKQLKSEVDDVIKNRNQSTILSMDLKGRLSPQETLASGARYNVPLRNALVLYVGMQAVQQLHSKKSQQLAALTAPITQCLNGCFPAPCQ